MNRVVKHGKTVSWFGLTDRIISVDQIKKMEYLENTNPNYHHFTMGDFYTVIKYKISDDECEDVIVTEDFGYVVEYMPRTQQPPNQQRINFRVVTVDEHGNPLTEGIMMGELSNEPVGFNINIAFDNKPQCTGFGKLQVREEVDDGYGGLHSKWVDVGID